MYQYDGTNYSYPQLPAATETRGRRSRTATTKRKPKRVVNYAGKNRAKTDELHARMYEALTHLPAISVRELGEIMGMSRQLTLYHVKKMVAHGQLIAELAPCHQNGGVQFVLYTKLQRAVELGAWLLREQGRMAA